MFGICDSGVIDDVMNESICGGLSLDVNTFGRVICEENML